MPAIIVIDWPYHAQSAKREPLQERCQGLGHAATCLRAAARPRRHCPSILCACSIAVFWKEYIQHVGVLGLLVAGILIAGSSPGYGQEPEVVPIVTRAGAHDDFGRIVFDWPRAVAYGARIKEKTLTVMFDRHLTTLSSRYPAILVRISPPWTSAPTATAWSPP